MSLAGSALICSEFRLQAARNRVNAELQTSNQGSNFKTSYLFMKR